MGAAAAHDAAIVLPEDNVFAHLLEKLYRYLERLPNRRRDEYLASSADLGELERRMRALDSESYFN